MNEILSRKDYELLSDYIDQELSDEDLCLFADRLSGEQSLREELGDFLQLKRMAREMPEVPAPRNYFLTRSMADEARTPSLLERLFPFCRVASLLCALILLASFIFPGVVGINPRTDMARSVLAEGTVAKSLQDEQILLNSAAPSGQIVSMPSRGVLGGTPKNQYLISGGLDGHPDHMGMIWPEDPHLDAFHPLGGTVPAETGGFHLPQPSVLLRSVTGTFLTLCLLWMAATWRKRQSLRVK